MKGKNRVYVFISVGLFVALVVVTFYFILNEKACEDDIPDERVTIEFLTDKDMYESGEAVTFILRNNGTENLTYDTNLVETIQIFEPGGRIVVMRPHEFGLMLTNILPGEEITWTWNQTYYLYVLEEGKLEPTWDYKSWTQVHSRGIYTASISFGDIENEASFWIGD